MWLYNFPPLVGHKILPCPLMLVLPCDLYWLIEYEWKWQWVSSEPTVCFQLSPCDSTIIMSRTHPRLAVGSKEDEIHRNRLELNLQPSQDDPHLEAELPKRTHGPMLNKNKPYYGVSLSFVVGCTAEFVALGNWYTMPLQASIFPSV